MGQLEAPVGLAALRLESGLLVIGQFQCGAVVDGGKATGLLALAAAVQLVGCFIAGIEKATAAQISRHSVIAVEAL